MNWSLPAGIAACLSAAALGSGLSGAAGVAPTPRTQPALTVTTVANPRPELISGPQTLIRVALTSPAAAKSLHVTENGRDITGSFLPQSDGSYLGLATNLRPGANLITAVSRGHRATVLIEDHALGGPVFSGPQQHPFFCETTAFGLAPSSEPDCSAPTQISYLYKSVAGGFKPLSSPAERPTDLVHATMGGATVPYIVRLETGTIDRAVYQTSALFDGFAPSPLRRDTAWNGKLVYSFGGGCNGGYHQGNVTGGVLNDLLLSQGYAVASSSLNVLDQNCSTMLSAEAAMMVKEHFIDTYGPVTYTIGWGSSGGAIQQYDIADAYPGILDGILPGLSSPDPLTVGNPVGDCRLLDRFFTGPGSTFTAAQRSAVAGFLNYDTCLSWDHYFGNRMTPTGSCNKQLISVDNAIPAVAMWSPQNQRGVKCSTLQQLANQLGIDHRTGFVPSPMDNTGVQYGLAALNSRQITPQQFISLNQAIGGFDVFGTPVPQRSRASSMAVATAFRDDVVLSGSLGLRITPIIDLREYLDQAGPLADIHTTQWSYTTRARLLAANGTAANQVIIESQASPAEAAALNVYALQAMDQWLANLAADSSPGPIAMKVIADKPSGLGDGCYLSVSERILAPLTDPATGPCAGQYPIGSTPRLVAGEPRTANVFKCRLRPIDFGAYQVTFTSAQQAELRSVFPAGVCDYRHPGLGQVPPAGPWLNYSDTGDDTRLAGRR